MDSLASLMLTKVCVGVDADELVSISPSGVFHWFRERSLVEHPSYHCYWKVLHRAS